MPLRRLLGRACRTATLYHHLDVNRLVELVAEKQRLVGRQEALSRLPFAVNPFAQNGTERASGVTPVALPTG
jgi:hypothetical protein